MERVNLNLICIPRNTCAISLLSNGNLLAEECPIKFVKGKVNLWAKPLKAVYIHCRSQALQLVCVNAAQQFSDIKKIFSVLNSLSRVLYNSPKNLQQFKVIQEILEDPDIELYGAGETRWISHYRCILATTICLNSIITTLQQIHSDDDDLSSEAAGLLLTLQTEKGITLLFFL